MGNFKKFMAMASSSQLYGFDNDDSLWKQR